MSPNNELSELGSKLGVNYVCASFITPMEQNYYIVVKLISVSTELVTKQVNQMARSGLENIYKTAQIIGRKLVGEVGFSTESVDIPTEQVAQNSLVVPITSSATSPLPITYEEFYYQLSKEREVLIENNPQALDIYQKYKSYRTAGWWLFGGGLTATVVGGIILSSSGSTGIVLGGTVASLGSIATITGIVFLIAKPYLKTTYNYYIQGGAKQSFHLDFSPVVSTNHYGVGLRVCF